MNESDLFQIFNSMKKIYILDEYSKEKNVMQLGFLEGIKDIFRRCRLISTERLSKIGSNLRRF